MCSRYLPRMEFGLPWGQMCGRCIQYIQVDCGCTFLAVRLFQTMPHSLWVAFLDNFVSVSRRYGSALLSAYIAAALAPCSKNVDTVRTTALDSPLQIKLQSTLKDSSVTVLELGSGAVGLAGLVLAWCYQQHQTEKGQRRRVLLTDYEHHVLHQLKRNVSRNAHLLQTDFDDNETICIDVTPLDWGKPPTDWNAYFGLGADQAIDLIIGSELVYTQKTPSPVVIVSCP